MWKFEEYQSAATGTPLSLRNNRDRIILPVLGLQTDAGKVGSLLATAFGSGKLELTREQTSELCDRLSDMLYQYLPKSSQAATISLPLLLGTEHYPHLFEVASCVCVLQIVEIVVVRPSH